MRSETNDRQARGSAKQMPVLDIGALKIRAEPEGFRIETKDYPEMTTLLAGLHAVRKSPAGEPFAGVIEQLVVYCRGKQPAWTRLRELLPARLLAAPFPRAIFHVLCTLPFGRVIGYGALAGRAGYPGAARAVGNLMRKNPLPLLVPCHRVIQADGRPGSYSGFANNPLKKKLLLQEGVAFSGERVRPEFRV